MTRLSDATWPEVARLDGRRLIVALGSTEQHGPHLPLSTDTLIAEALAGHLTDLLPGSTLGPTIPIGASGEHAGFAGTLSIGTEALTTLLIELVRDADRDWDEVVLVNGHGGNAAAIRAAAAVWTHEGRAVRVVGCGLPGMDAHAGLAETSLLLHLHPDLVRLDRVAPGNTDPVVDLLPRMTAGGVLAVSDNGVLGDPRDASADDGRRLFEQLVAQAQHVLRRAR